MTEDLNTLLQSAAAADFDADERWAIIGQLHRATDRATFDAACALARSADLRQRVLGLNIIAQFGYPADFPFRPEALPVVLAACDDHRCEVLCSAITALGHLGSAQATSVVLRHVGHPRAEVRFAVTSALPGLPGDPPEPEVIAALIRLSGDPDSDVRDWATFAIGSQFEQVDSPDLRAALAARLEDSDGDTAGEAVVGLALRHDDRALAPLLRWLDADPCDFDVEVAAALGSPALMPALRRLKARGWDGGTALPTVLDQAIAACSR